MLELLGRVHVLLLHLPIGLLAGVVTVELWAWLRKDERAGSANGLLTALLALSALAAAVTGLVLGRDQSGDTVFWHRWTGIGLAVLCCGVAWLRWRWQSVGTPGGAVYAGSVVMAAGLTVLVGHLGGSITHGDDYLWPASREPAPSVPLPLPTATGGGDGEDPDAPPPQVDIFATVIVPIFEDRCVECHGDNKQKGGLRLDSPGAIQAGGHSGPVIVPGHPERSLMIELVSLPPEHDDVMPPKGDPLTPAQVQALNDWIATGASFSLEGPESGVGGDLDAPTALDRLAASIAPPQIELMRRVVDSGLNATPVSDNGALLDVDAGSLGAGLGEEHLKLLRELRHHVVWLDLGRTPITDDQLFVLQELPNLRRLQLHQTGITDAALATIAGCRNLESLNLFGTAITDAGVPELARMESLQHLYIWNTRITQNGAEILKKALPDTEINRGE